MTLGCTFPCCKAVEGPCTDYPRSPPIFRTISLYRYLTAACRPPLLVPAKLLFLAYLPPAYLHQVLSIHLSPIYLKYVDLVYLDSSCDDLSFTSGVNETRTPVSNPTLIRCNELPTNSSNRTGSCWVLDKFSSCFIIHFFQTVLLR